jgi:hypothetical protein
VTRRARRAQRGGILLVVFLMRCLLAASFLPPPPFFASASHLSLVGNVMEKVQRIPSVCMFEEKKVNTLR